MKTLRSSRFAQRIFLVAALALTPLVTLNAANTPPPAVAPNPLATAKLSASAREVVRMVSSGVPDDVVKAYVESYPSAFNLNADNIIAMQGVGVSSAVMTGMLNHDKTLRENMGLYASTMQPPMQPSATAPYPSVAQPADTSYGDDTDYYGALAPYGNWNYMDGYGWGWQPYSTLGFDAYPWGILGFGGWCNFPGRGWCWFPNSRFRSFNRFGAFAGNRFGGRFDGRFNTGFRGNVGVGINRGFTVNRATGFRGFTPTVNRFGSGGAFSGTRIGGGVHSFGGGGHSFGGGGGARGGGGGHR
ncbi:MAG TPA: hypothetical protein VH413_04750 [Verrucomicrobiae bacterium]|jgi:hypothetical protein|nr:hypothetical protein [Verrucomicrobiae bacterium]